MPHVGGKNAKKKSSSSTTSKRHFTVVMGNKEHGLYVSSSPSSAARKAVSKLCATDKKKKVQFSIREITQGSKKKTYGPYLGTIEKLAKPIELKGRVIRYKPVAKLSKKTGGDLKNTSPYTILPINGNGNNKNNDWIYGIERNNNNVNNNLNDSSTAWFHGKTRIKAHDMELGKIYRIRRKKEYADLDFYKVIEKDDEKNIIKLAKLKTPITPTAVASSRTRPKILTVSQDIIYGYEYDIPPNQNTEVFSEN